MRKRQEKGSVLVVTLLVLGALTVLGIATINMSGLDAEIALNQRAGDQALYVAEAGVYLGVEAVTQNPALANGVLTGLPGGIEQIKSDGTTDVSFPGVGGATNMDVQVGAAPGATGLAVQCGLRGYSDRFGTVQFQVVSRGSGPSGATREVQAIMRLPPTEGLCPPGQNVKGGYMGG